MKTMSYIDCMIARKLMTSKEPQKIIDVICRLTGATKDQIIGQSKHRKIVYSRQLCMYLMAEFFPLMTLREIGREFDSRDHSTVIHSKQTIRNTFQLNDEWSVEVKKLYREAKKILINNFYLPNKV